MSVSRLPDRPSLEYLKKLAKERLRQLRRSDARARLADAQLAVAREHGFASWRALKAEVESRQQVDVARFFAACASGDVSVLRALLEDDPAHALRADPSRPHGGWTGLHSAAQAGHVAAVRLLLQRGADPNAREAGDHTYALHWAAAARHLEVVRVLLDAGADVHGTGDVHALDVIGWASFYHPPGRSPGDNPEVVALLRERGARHHIFSALCMGDPALIREVVAASPNALARRMSRFEQERTPLHFALALKRYDLLDLLIELGADLEAKDRNGHTAMAAALLSGDSEGMKRLSAAGARRPPVKQTPDFRADMSRLGGSVRKLVPMIEVRDVARALDWYVSIGFTEVARYEDDGIVNFGMVSYGRAEIMLNLHGRQGRHDASLWFYTDRIDQLYELLLSRRLLAAEAQLSGAGGAADRIEFIEYMNEPFYGGREFGIRDLNGYNLYFMQA